MANQKAATPVALSEREEAVMAEAEPISPQLSVRDYVYGLANSNQLGAETAVAFVATFGQDTATEAEIALAVARFCARVV